MPSPATITDLLIGDGMRLLPAGEIKPFWSELCRSQTRGQLARPGASPAVNTPPLRHSARPRQATWPPSAPMLRIFSRRSRHWLGMAWSLCVKAVRAEAHELICEGFRA
jgi:hypothetical protein